MPVLALLAVAAVILPVAVSTAGAAGGAEAPSAPLLASDGAHVVTRTIGGERAVIASPRAPTNRVVIFSHGKGRDAAGLMNDAAPLVGGLLAHGYTVVTSDAHGDAWGNPASREDYVEVARAMRRRGLDEVFMLARSMGGLASLATIRRIRPVAWAGIYPACNLRSLRTFRASITRAWGAPWPRLARAGVLDPVPPRGVGGLPMIFWASSGDTVVSKRRNTDVCAAAARRAGASVTVVPTAGDHGHPSNSDPERLAAFFDAAAQSRSGHRALRHVRGAD